MPTLSDSHEETRKWVAVMIMEMAVEEIEERFERESDWRMAREQVGAKSETKVEEGWPGTTECAFGVSQILLPLFLQFCFFDCCCLFFIAVLRRE